MTPDISVIIVNWNTRQLLADCLRSLPEAGSYEVIVVDNGSTDGSVAMVAEQFPHVVVIANRANTGYAHANNQGLERATGRHLLLLNSDTRLSPTTLSTIVNYLDNHPLVGVAGCQLRNPDGTIQPSVRRLPTLWDQAIILTKLPNFFPGLISHHLMADFDYHHEAIVEQVMGSCLAIRRPVLTKVGLLDEHFWSWFEDVDYCKRVNDAGWQVAYTPTTFITHLKGQSFDQHRPLAKQKIWIKSLLWYMRKHHGFWSAIVLSPLAVVSLGLAALVGLFGVKKKNRQL